MITQNLNKQQLNNFFSPISHLLQSFQAKTLYALSDIFFLKYDRKEKTERYSGNFDW